jgi:UDP-N-acetylmuramyl pentapeptide synthase
LNEIAQCCGGILLQGEGTRRVARVCTDSRQARANDLFVALRGDRFDGHDFLSVAAEKGAEAALVETARAAVVPPRPASPSVPDERSVEARPAPAPASVGPGDLIRLTGGTFKVVGIYNSGDGFEDAASIVSLSDAQQLLQKHRQVGAVQVKVKDPRQIETLRAELEKQFPRLSVSQSGEVPISQMVQYIQVSSFTAGAARRRVA